MLTELTSRPRSKRCGITASYTGVGLHGLNHLAPSYFNTRMQTASVAQRKSDYRQRHHRGLTELSALRLTESQSGIAARWSPSTEGARRQEIALRPCRFRKGRRNPLLPPVAELATMYWFLGCGMWPGRSRSHHSRPARMGTGDAPGTKLPRPHSCSRAERNSVRRTVHLMLLPAGAQLPLRLSAQLRTHRLPNTTYTVSTSQCAPFNLSPSSEQ